MKSLDHVIKVACLCATVSLIGCDPGQPEANSGFNVSGVAAPLSQAEFNALPPEDQYQVASKLYGTLFRGISAEDFFDLSVGTENLSSKSTTFLTDTKKALSTSLSVSELSAANTLIEGR